MKSGKQPSWEDDFRTFLEAGPEQAPRALSESIVGTVESDLQPSFWKVLLKIAGIQAAAGAVSLLFCPQFGVSFTSSNGLMPYLMRFGLGVCMLGCGAFFTGLSLLIASWLLRPEEVRALRERRLFQLTVVAALSLGAFICSGAEVLASLALAWALGAIVGGMATLELGWSFRKLSYRRSIL